MSCTKNVDGAAAASTVAVPGFATPPRSLSLGAATAESFVHLHVHSEYSFLDGGSSMEALVRQAAEEGMPALALTDHNGLYGAVKFIQTCRAFGVVPLLGAEVTMEDETHLTLLAETRAGYANLCHLITLAHAHGGRKTPRLPWTALCSDESGRGSDRQDMSGLICLTGCRKGIIPRLVADHRYREAQEAARELHRTFGEGNVLVELQDDWTPGSRLRCRTLALLAFHAGLPVVATNNVHYATRDDSIAHEVLRAVATSTKVAGFHKNRPLNAERSLKSARRMRSLFRYREDACDNTLRIAERCAAVADAILPPDGAAPIITPGWGSTDAAAIGELRRRTFDGARERYGRSGGSGTRDREGGSVIRSRIDHELSVISRLGFAPYVLHVQEIVAWARAEGIRVTGRGSAADSCVAYCLRLTDVDVIRRDLPFARFLMEGKTPDIDLDFPSDRRDEVFTHIQQKYGADRTARCCTFHTFLARSAARDVGKALGLPQVVLEWLSERLHHFARADSIDAAFDKYAELKEHQNLRPRVQTLASLCARIAGFPRHLGSHSSGVVIAGVPLAGIAPVESAASGVLPIWTLDKDDAETVGAIKVDILALRMLQAVAGAEADIARRSNGASFRYDAIPLDDKDTFEMIRAGKAIGAFQLESAAQLALAPQLLPDAFEHLVASVALIRPGPVRGNAVQRYISGRHGWTRTAALHPCLEPILAKSFGCIIFQEQVDLVVAAMTGWSHEAAERFRKRLAKHEKAGTLQEAEQEFFVAVHRWWPDIGPRVVRQLWQSIDGWGGYGFIEGHAASFGLTAYKTAYLSVHHPAEFFAGEMNAQPMGFWPPNTLAAEARRRGVRILPVDINVSSAQCEAAPDADGNAIRLGLNLVSELRAGDAAAIVAERERDGPFRSLLDLSARVILRRNVIENLVLCGALDSIEERRRRGLLFALDQTLEAALWLRRTRSWMEGTGTLRFRYGDASTFLTPCAETIEDFSVWDQFLWTWRLTGITAECHTFSYLRDGLAAARVTTCYDALHLPAGTRCVVAGLNIRPHLPPTKSGKPVLFTSVEDETDVLHVTCVGEAIDTCTATLLLAPAVLVEGTIERHGPSGQRASLLVERAKTLNAERFLLLDRVLAKSSRTELPSKEVVVMEPHYSSSGSS